MPTLFNNIIIIQYYNFLVANFINLVLYVCHFSILSINFYVSEKITEKW